MSAVIGTKFNMKLYITMYIWVPNFVICYKYILRYDIQDGHFKIQYGGRVSCQYQFHMDPYNIQCMCANFGSPVVNIF